MPSVPVTAPEALYRIFNHFPITLQTLTWPSAMTASGFSLAPVVLAPVINSENYEGDVFVADDESYLIVPVYGRKDGFGEGDLYVSFRNIDGSWSPLKNMGAAINSDKRDFCPMVTPDGKYFFFSSKRAGEGDIFWVDAKVINALRVD